MANLNDTIVAISTAIGEAGIAIVRMSGDDSVNIIDKIFVSASGKRWQRQKIGSFYMVT